MFELEVGARRAGRKMEFQTHFAAMPTYPLTQAILILSRNQVIGLIDTFIAATALHYALPLLTLNTRHFERVSGLKLLPTP